MNQSTMQFIEEMVFMERMNQFEKPDVIIYHPGHFPELNEQLLSYYNQFGSQLIMIPEGLNRFLNCDEFEFYAPRLISLGINKEKLMSIPVAQNVQGVEGVIKSAFEIINKTGYRNILLAGKSFFCKRFYLLASLYAAEEKVLDILPLQDNREIIPAKWADSEKGKARVLNEVEQYAKILKEKIANA